jgi:hypothetical protein
MIRFLWAFLCGLVVFPCAAFLYLWLGYAPVATKAAPLPFEKRITALALNARVSRDASKQAGLPPRRKISWPAPRYIARIARFAMEQ